MRPRPTLNVSLTPALVDYLAGHVRSGRYGSASEVVRAALRLLQREEPGINRAVRCAARKARPKASSGG